MKNNLLGGASRHVPHPAMLCAPRNEVSTLEVKNAVDDAMKAMKAFMEKNDERLKEIEKKGVSDALLNEHVNRINADLGEASKKIDDFIAAQKKRSDELEMAMNRQGLGASLDAPLSVNALAERHAAIVQARCGRKIDMDTDAFVEYAKAAKAFLRHGALNIGENARNALSVGSDKDGGYLVEPDRLDRIMKRVFDTSPVRQYANVITTSSDKIEIPLDVNEAATGGWAGEWTEPSDTNTPELGLQTIELFLQIAMPSITQQLIEDASFDVEAWLEAKIADKFSRTENTAFVTGNGVKKPRGFMSYSGTAVTTADASRAWGKIQYLFTGQSGAFAGSGAGADKLIDVVHAMKSGLRAGALWFANRGTFAEVRKLKDGDGNYLWSMGDIQKGQPSTLLGYGTAEMEDMATIAANSFSLAFANLKEGYLIADRLGLSVMRDPYTGKPKVKYFSRKRVGGDVINFDAIKYLKFGTT